MNLQDIRSGILILGAQDADLHHISFKTTIPLPALVRIRKYAGAEVDGTAIVGLFTVHFNKITKYCR